MNEDQYFQPIVVAKPTRGREMQSTAIPKDMLYSSKDSQSKKDNTNLMVPKEKDMDIYHEGYVDGKLYLVPDSNLQAMRDIVNLKMKRQHSSGTKPQTSLDEPTQYNEFTSKLDGLLEKVGNLAKGSQDESGESMEESVMPKNNEEKVLDSITSQDSNISKFVTQKKHQLPGLATIADESEGLVSSEKKTPIPPIMDEKIKYIRVRPKEPSKKSIQSQSLTEYEIKSQFDKIKNKEVVRLLISGHLKKGVSPVFIVHKNYNGPSPFTNHIPDFKTHKKEGNIDVFISGKFFSECILLEESTDSKIILNLKPERILLDRENQTYKEKFKDIYHVGPADIVLEGEFKKDEKTSKYTPVLSLEIIKNKSLQETDISNKSNDSTILSNIQSKILSFSESFQKILNNKNKKKRVHYASEPKNKWGDIELENKHIFSDIKKSIMGKHIFNKSKESLSSLEKGFDSLPSPSSKPRTSKSRREELAHRRKSRLRERKLEHDKSKKLEQTKRDIDDTLQVDHMNKKNQPLKTSKGESPNNSTRSFSEENLPVKKIKKIKRKQEDKNQAIVENPILAQMQEFFLA